ncbi:MAG: hypothetical protein H6739_30160 [Alphaproteobacteria bacterium]|nr:hypothetical protein [Alphaproteobacteria bacterium]
MRHLPLLLVLAVACRTKDDTLDDTSIDPVSDEDGDGYAAEFDCDDADAAVNPGVDETPYDGVDNDCDPATADDDLDADGYGVAEDCDDADAAIHPGATEVCNGIDDDCSGAADDAVGELFYADNDGDGYGDPAISTQSCDGAEGYVADDRDCDDADPAINPAAYELCDAIDNDCDGDVDEDDAYDADTWYADTDADGYGDPASSARACAQPSGYVADDTDCDDTAAEVRPGAAEDCDGVDDDCDGAVDEGSPTDAPTWYADADADGYGAADYTARACTQPSGYVADDTDCDDDEASVYPGASEDCDRVDDDCDGAVDEGVTSTWYLDSDGDGYGDSARSTEACSAPTAAYVATGGDCDDFDTAYNPGATPGCDGEDYDCDGLVDNDGDGDTYADASCGGTDCDDSDASILPELGGGCAMGTTCLDILDSGRSSGDDVYTIDPDGYATGADPFDVDCDMTTDGGGWTLIDGALIEDQGWMTFAFIAGSGTYDAAWLTTPGTFWLRPNSDASCDTMALRATTTLPFTFDEWMGEWTGTGASTSSQQDDTRSDLAWGETTTDCNGHVKFGTDQDDSKIGGEWGIHWNSYSPYYQVWSWGQETVSTTDVLRWEVVDQASNEDVVFEGIAIWVR